MVKRFFIKPVLAVFSALLVGIVIGYYLAYTKQDMTSVSYADEAKLSLSKKTSNAHQPDGWAKKTSNAEHEVVRLQAMNKTLQAQIARMHLPVSDAATYPALLEKIDKLPMALIEDQLTHVLTAEQLKQIKNPRALSKRLLEVALEEPNISDDKATADIIFSTSPVYGKDAFVQSIDLNKFDTVFAHILSQDSLADIVVKWQNAQSGEIHSFRGSTLEHSSVAPYVLMRPNAGWHAGRYIVSIHRLDEALSFVAANAFEVRSVAQNSAGQISSNEHIIQDLIASGQAVRKQPLIRE